MFYISSFRVLLSVKGALVKIGKYFIGYMITELVIYLFFKFSLILLEFVT